MANVLSNLMPDLYASLDIVSRELVGMIPSVTLDAQASRAALNQNVRIPIAPSNTAGFDVTPAMSIPNAADQTITNSSIVINKSRGRPFSWSGAEQYAMDSNGAGYFPIRANQMLQAMRALVNEIELDLANLYATTSRAYGAAATTPFGTAGDFTDATNALKILKDNGAPLSDNQLVINTAAGASFLGKQGNYSVTNDPGIMRQGVFLTTSGMDIRESGQIQTHTAGTMASATSTSAAFTVGQTVIPLATAGTGVVAAGDVITFANDTNKYVVASVSFAGANPASGDTITLAAPGLRVAQGVATRAITVVATSARNMAFNRSAIVLATRLPERPVEGDLALDVTTITDPRSGLSFEVAVYAGQRMVRYEVAAAWGVKNIKPEHTALLLG
jgi:P22 coat protein - gene protein 5